VPWTRALLYQSARIRPFRSNGFTATRSPADHLPSGPQETHPTSGQPALSAHVLVDPGQNCHAVLEDLASLLADEHHIEHVTLQVDHANPSVLTITDRASVEQQPDHCEDPHGPIHRPDSEPNRSPAHPEAE
jgi:hypothetical protein